MIAAITLFLVVALSALITKIATIALIHTGLSTQSARFQARSAYTGAGFTTSESEKIMNHPVRRKIIFNLMLIGNAGIVTVMSSLILTFVLPDTLTSKLYGLAIVVLGLSLIWWAIKSEWVDRVLSKIINRMLKKYTDLDILDYAAVLHLKDDYKISERKVAEDSWMANKTLMELDLRHEGITVLGIYRADCDYIGSPTGSFEILPRDVLTIYGKAEVIKNLYSRKRDFVASMAHKEYVAKENKRIEKQSADRNQANN
ncbi:cation:proton antiporter regulatory subunit [Aequorivita marisscotiae]|uniref:TrkA C-terminal domain-containing protein n=2 Tax=Aequorivita TaxID=153265 RepID=A0ABY8KVE1_9FLAO|nr:TrkA C-terminal domain-containing protein [Aequorivita sp. Ant34-E75]WGF93393.1 TrkA C-terminal domain-containing protein [Aequorivita sp. Ant34-E75]